MADPIHNFFTVQNRAGECLEPPPASTQDPCKITLEEAVSETSFLLERKGQNFQIAPADALKVSRAFPGYSVPSRMLSDYLLVRGEFVKALGDEKNPSTLMEKINLETDKDKKVRAIAQWTNILSNFVALGQLAPHHPKMRQLQIHTIGIAFYSFADPILGVTIEKIFKKLLTDPKVSPESRKRIDWVLQIYSAREKFWSLLNPKMEQSAQLSKELKARSVSLFTFLFANHLMAENSSTPHLFTEEMKSTAKVYGDILSKVDSSYDASKNFYAFIATAMKEMRQFALKPEYQKDFQIRASFIQGQFEKAAQQEMIDILSGKPREESFREYLGIKYGTTPERAAALGVILRNMLAGTEKGKQPYSFDMAKISHNLQAWAGAKSGKDHQEAIEAILYLLQALFERGEKMEVFLDKKIRSMDNFYESGQFDLPSMNKKSLEDLISWTRGSAKKARLPLRADDNSHLGVRKWTLAGELGASAVGVGTSLVMHYAMKDPAARQYGTGAGIALGAAGVCAAGGNLLSHKLNMNGNGWILDLSGALLCGAAASTIYGFTSSQGGNQVPASLLPGPRYPVDPYGP